MKKFLSRMIDSLPKRIAASALFALAVALPVAASAAQTVSFTATAGIAVLGQDSNFSKQAVSATYDQEVEVEVTYNNTEAAGSNKVANNVNVKINVPTSTGASHTIATTTSVDNIGNPINKNVSVATPSDAYLQYEPGTAVWKHADAQTGQVVTQNLGSAGDGIASANGLTLGNVNACQAGSVTIKARVMVPGVTITKKVKDVTTGATAWTQTNTANPGDTLKYEIYYKNSGNTKETNVDIYDSLPPKLNLVPGTTVLYNSTNPNGYTFTSNAITSDGINIGGYNPGGDAYVTFEVTVPGSKQLACGNTEFRNVAAARPDNMSWYYNTAITNVMNQCSTPTQPTYTCNLLTVNKLGGREIEAKVDYAATNGATLKDITYDFGDNSTPLTTDKSDVKYTYAQDGNYQVTAKLLFSVNGKDQTVNSDSCTQPVSFSSTPSTPTTPASPTTPSELPNTGAGNVIALFASASVAGAVAYRLFLARRLARQS